mmetsp:Transcript_7144/g.12772  ORF Transcript_7144/g.12772 Transcript_7144/m.12772 type:complete len:430 (-) Transcript_7144:2012-3301(-)
MQGELWLKIQNGTWELARCKVDGNSLECVRCKDEEERIDVRIEKNQTRLRQVEFGLRKHVFEVEYGKQCIQLGANSEDEKYKWLSKLNSFLEDNKENCHGTSIKIPKGKVGTIQSLLLSLPGGALGGGVLTEQQATERLQRKLVGKVQVQEVAASLCLICKKQVGCSEAINLPGGDTVIHVQCSFCCVCAIQLNKSEIQVCKTNNKLYCETHLTRGEKELCHNAVLGRPTVTAKRRRRRPARKPSKMEPVEPVGDASICHFGVSGKRCGRIIFKCSSNADRRKWHNTITNISKLVELRNSLVEAQRVDMLSAIQAQVNIQRFEDSHQTSHSGHLDICIKKKRQIKWKPAFVILDSTTSTLLCFAATPGCNNQTAQPFLKLDFKERVQLVNEPDLNPDNLKLKLPRAEEGNQGGIQKKTKKTDSTECTIL